MPSFLGRQMQRRLRAGPGTEDLQGRCPHFYDVGQEMAALTPADEALPAFVFATFQGRYRVRQHRVPPAHAPMAHPPLTAHTYVVEPRACFFNTVAQGSREQHSVATARWQSWAVRCRSC